MPAPFALSGARPSEEWGYIAGCLCLVRWSGTFDSRHSIKLSGANKHYSGALGLELALPLSESLELALP